MVDGSSDRKEREAKALTDAALAEKAADASRLAEVRAARAAADRQKAKDKAQKQGSVLAKQPLAKLAAGCAKLETSLGAFGVMTAATWGALSYAEGMPKPKAVGLVKAAAGGAKVLAELVGEGSAGEERAITVLRSAEDFICSSPARAEACGAAAAKICQVWYDADVASEEAILKWWAEREAEGAKLSADAAASAADVERLTVESADLAAKAKDTDEALAKAKKQTELTAKEMKYAKTGSNPSPDEQAREKEAIVADRLSNKEWNRLIPLAAKARKSAGEAATALTEAQAATAANAERLQLFNGYTEHAKAFITWLQEAEEDDD